MERAGKLAGGVADHASRGVPRVIRSPDWEIRGVIAAFATRRQPVPSEHTDECNISLSIGRNPGEVMANRAVLAHCLGLEGKRLATVRQCHWAPVVEVSAGSLSYVEGPVRQPPGCGMVTADPRVALLIGTADCLPVLLADLDGRGVGALHIGWRELAGGAVERGVRGLLNLGGRLHRISAWLGPCICSGCYIVGEDVRDRVGRRYPTAASRSASGSPALDLVEGACEALRYAGVEAISTVGYCTLEHPSNLYSRRRDGPTGIQGSFIALK
jgi:YfiH family protein